MRERVRNKLRTFATGVPSDTITLRLYALRAGAPPLANSACPPPGAADDHHDTERTRAPDRDMLVEQNRRGVALSEAGW
jgi:hypothetical protein